MEEFINLAVKQLGISKEAGTSATGGLLGLLQKQLGGGDFSKVFGAIPGASQLAGSAGGGPGGSGGGGGLLGSALGAIGSKVGIDLGGAAGLLGVLGKSGLNTDQFGPFVKLFMDFVKGKTGPGAADTIMNKLPELKKLLG